MKLPNRPVSSLKRNYLLYFETALIITLGTFIGLFNLNFVDQGDQPSKWTISEHEILHLESIVTTTHGSDIPSPPPDAFVPNPPPQNEIVEEQLQNLDIEFPLSDPLPVPVYTSQKLPTSNNTRSIIPTKDMPQLVGGMEKLQRNISYPPRAFRDRVEGRVIVEFIVDEKGKVRNPKIIKGVRNDINREALRAISKARFLPAREQGKPIPVEHVIFILFSLDNS